MYRDEVGAKPKKKEVLKHVVNRRRRHTRLLDLDVGRSNSSHNPTLKVMPSPFSHSYPPVRFFWKGAQSGSQKIPGGLKELLKERRTYEKRREGLLETDESEPSFREQL